MIKHNPVAALMFLVCGALILCGFHFVIEFGNSMGGAGDGISGGSVSPGGIILPYAGYFLCGIIASFIPIRILRIFFAVTGHILPFASIMIERDRNLAAFFLRVNLVLFLIFGFVWYEILRKPNGGTNTKK